jgi:transposase InsO family protein
MPATSWTDPSHRSGAAILEHSLYRDTEKAWHGAEHEPAGKLLRNAVAEGFFSSLKNELVNHCSFRTRDEARSAVFEYIEVFYNRQRRHQFA